LFKRDDASAQVVLLWHRGTPSLDCRDEDRLAARPIESKPLAR
jgi:hypothetical protein